MLQFLNIVTFKIKGISVLTFLFQTIINEQLLILIYLFVFFTDYLKDKFSEAFLYSFSNNNDFHT